MIKKGFSLCTLLVFFMQQVHYAQTTATSSATGGTSSPINNQPGNISGAAGNGYSADLYSGTVNANIPIYDYSVDDLNLGVSLSYNTGGIKVDQIASQEGLGWNLNAGAYISRQVNGIEDELTFSALGPYSPASNGYPIPAVPKQSGSWVSGNFANNYQPRETDIDVFTAVLGDRTINFSIFILPDQTKYIAVTSPKSEIRVDVLFDNGNIYDYSAANITHMLADTLIEQSSSQGILSFLITDEKGNRYIFEKGDMETKKYVDTSTSPQTTYYNYPVEKWVIKKIITYAGHEIDYSYNYYSVNYPYYRDQQVAETKSYVNNGQTILPGIKKVRDSIVFWQGSVAHISEIDYPNGLKLHFNMDNTYSRRDIDGTNALDNITIESKYDNNVGNKFTYKFHYAYFNADPNDTEISYGSGSVDQYNLRLKLKEIDRIGTDNSTSEPYYILGYNNQHVLPSRLSTAQDCYGYSNESSPYTPSVADADLTNNPSTTSYSTNSSFNNVSIPYHAFLYDSIEFSGPILHHHQISYLYGAYRTDYFYAAEANMLTSITNGLGGRTEFYYQQHNLFNPPITTTSNNTTVTNHYYTTDETGTVGSVSPDIEYNYANDGVCIDHIVSSDGVNPDNTTTTYYTFSGGQRFFAGGYFWYPTVVDFDFPNNLDSSRWDGRIYTNRFISPMDFINGCNHGYSEATVKVYGYNSELISHTHNTFTNVDVRPDEIDSQFIYLNGSFPYTGTTNWAYPFSYSNEQSRIQTRWGLFTHTLPRIAMHKQLMGLPIETDEYDNNGNVISQTVNRYNVYESNTSSDSPPFVNINGVQDPFYNHEYFTYYDPAAGSYITVNGQYAAISAEKPLLKTSTTTNSSNGQNMSVTKYYGYDELGNQTSVVWQDSKGDWYKKGTTINRYTYTKGDGYSNDQLFMQLPYAETTAKVSGSSSTTVGFIGSQIMGNINTPAAPVINNIYFGPGAIGNLRYYSSQTFSSNSTTPYLAKYYSAVDDQKNVLETSYDNNSRYSSNIWDTRIGQKLAEVQNAHYTEIAYSSFEGPFANFGTADYNKGNWDFQPGNIVLGSANDKAVTGRYYYSLTANASIVSTVSTTMGKKYLLSFWAQGSVIPTASTLVWSNNLAATANLNLSQQIQINNWTLYTAYFDGSGSTVTISVPSNSTVKIDELRLYPADAVMDTYTYEPLLGVSSHCDERNNISYYEYDVQGRPKLVRDINGNIISLTKHVNQGNDN